ncbi:replication initiation protein RepC [Roseitranquillus sediminis]|uniref:replication initiation protein RepC n=1 Tax=Roseitranquillus sediminis TaxID=2809051 RepID=UPI001D0C2B50|nr:replication initiation protein RepC [Roseitranquillus sediminis]MBM9595044.1 hypothetical protein [Roseitranquillus sediminis]
MEAQQQHVPEALGKWQALRSVRALHRELGLSERACRALEIIAMPTRDQDWSSPGRSPICYRRQRAMAEELGVSPRQFHNIERQLERAGLIERRLTRNGWRGIAGGRAHAGISGLSLAPLIRSAGEFAARVAKRAAEREACAAIRVEIRVTWGRLARHLVSDPRALARASEMLAPPRTEALATWTRDALDRRLTDLQAALAETMPTADADAISDAPETDFRCHTRNTNKLERVSCSASTSPPMVDCPAEPRFTFAPAAPNSSARRDEGGPAKRSTAALAVTVGLLRQIATPELDFYLEGLDCRSIADAERATMFRLRELEISTSTYEAARRELGAAAAVLAIAVIDRNRSHPKTPVRYPGRVLHAMTDRCRHGALDLAASVHAIFGRRPGRRPIQSGSSRETGHYDASSSMQR